ncbi:hypothetical protein PEX1_042470 [Penicillium expansum]|uniref:Uncharacterized protein n=1 Tax=Penicillium expansum TaxID=27334 RepID=A0A0A2K9D1_PENEN|nr:hypothetical protein PEX2_003260 [Penicillium expansum]KGO42851.1 hypothetical protein PEXP_026000 [Penicillium expansum]KGO56972.1 hypothetical protein PEX2_003260 [Penicillium expansum]KGO64419.1 hypothetical protein PEX1_042470 [Penicillium expansum]
MKTEEFRYLACLTAILHFSTCTNTDYSRPLGLVDARHAIFSTSAIGCTTVDITLLRTPYRHCTYHIPVPPVLYNVHFILYTLPVESPRSSFPACYHDLRIYEPQFGPMVLAAKVNPDSVPCPPLR